MIFPINTPTNQKSPFLMVCNGIWGNDYSNQPENRMQSPFLMVCNAIWGNDPAEEMGSARSVQPVTRPYCMLYRLTECAIMCHYCTYNWHTAAIVAKYFWPGG